MIWTHVYCDKGVAAHMGQAGGWLMVWVFAIQLVHLKCKIFK